GSWAPPSSNASCKLATPSMPPPSTTTPLVSMFLEGEGVLLCCDEEKKKKKRLRVFHSDPLDYHSILDALKGSSALFYCFDPPPDHPIYQEILVILDCIGFQF
ncbi:cinnamoyl-CoA reductase, partial [Sarracenia purpurea var. burkii]